MAACACDLATSLQLIRHLQADVHAAFGGVVPTLAMEAHKAAMDSCVSDALEQAGIQAQDLHAVAVSIGPGLSPCLRVGLLPVVWIQATHISVEYLDIINALP